MELPRHVEAERAVLGGILVQNAGFFEVASRLKTEHFASPHHQAIYRTMQQMAAANRPMDILTVYAELGPLKEEIGASYLAKLPDGVPRSVNVNYYAGMVINAAKLRAVVLQAQAVIDAATQPSASAHEVIEQAQAGYFALSDDSLRQTLWSASDMTAELLAELDGTDAPVRSIPVGLPSIDASFDGFAPGDWAILAGRPSTGKTALAKQIALKAAERVPVLVFSAEMGHRAVWRRALSHVTRIGAWQMSRKRSADSAAVSQGLERLGGLRLWLSDTPGISDMHILSVARRVQLQHGLGLVIVDYLQLLQSSERTKTERRAQELEAVTRALKQIARTLDVPVLTLAALSRAAAGEKPTMAHIREVGTAEYDADVILLMHRDVQAQKDLAPGAPSPAELIIEKQRNGATGGIPLLFFGEQYRFESQVVQ